MKNRKACRDFKLSELSRKLVSGYEAFGQDKTGNCANADPFVKINNVLYNQDGLKPRERVPQQGRFV